jgi:hypothetical protein
VEALKQTKVPSEQATSDKIAPIVPENCRQFFLENVLENVSRSRKKRRI